MTVDNGSELNKRVTIGSGGKIGAGVTVEKDVEFGDNANIGDNVTVEKDVVESLASHFVLTSRQIKDAVLSATDASVLANGKGSGLSRNLLFEAARNLSAGDLTVVTSPAERWQAKW